MDQLRPPTPADIEPLIDWGIPPFDAVPAEDRPLVVAYYVATDGIPDCFAGFDRTPLADQAALGADGLAPAAAVDGFVRAHLGMLDI